MEGLKLIAQSTFDKHQKFRPSAATAPIGEGAYRYNVIEIGAFGGTSSSNITTSTAAKRQSVGSVQSSASGPGSRQGNGTGSAKISMNEWMVFEDDLGSFMKKRPVDQIPTTTASSGSGFGGELEKPKPAAPSTTTASTAPSKAASMPSRSRTPANTLTTATTTTAASTTHNNTNTTTTTSTDRPRKPREENEAVASLKLVCIPRADTTTAADGHHPNTLAIARETFLRLYVDHMDADHCALYYVAREYDGYHEFTDARQGVVVTKFLGTSDYALIWTFNRRTLETRGLFLDRCQRWRSSDSGGGGAHAHTTPSKSNPDGSGPMTPVNHHHHNNSKHFGGASDAGGSSPAATTAATTPSKRWARKQTGSVSASEAWNGFRDTLNTYRKYIFAPQVLSFVCCVQMLRSFDDQTNEDDLPRLKEVEAGISSVAGQQQQQADSESVGEGVGLGLSMSSSRGGDGGGLLSTTQGSSFALVADQPNTANPFAPSTPPPVDDEKLLVAGPATTTTHNREAADVAAAREKLAAQSLAVSRVSSSVADKLRHLLIARKILDVIGRENETLTVDVVAPSFLDRYHWAMEGMNDAIPALERHIASLEEFLRYLGGRAKRLGGLLVRSSHYHHLTPVLLAAASLRAPAMSSQSQSSDALSLRCNPGADSSRSDLDSVASLQQQQQQQQLVLQHRANAAAELSRGPVAHRVVGGGGGGGGGGTLPSVAAVFASRLDGEGAGGRRDDVRVGYGGGAEVVGWGAVERQPRHRAAGRRGFYAGYLVRGNYSHRLA